MANSPVWDKLLQHPVVAARTPKGQLVLEQVVEETLHLLSSVLRDQASVGTIFLAHIAFLDVCIERKFVERMAEAEGQQPIDRLVTNAIYGLYPVDQRTDLLQRLADLPGFLQSENMGETQYMQYVLGLNDVSLAAMVTGRLTIGALLHLQPEVIFMLKD